MPAAHMISDRQMTPTVAEAGVLCAAYVDGVAAISEDPARAKATIDAISKSLASENLDTGDQDETEEIFTRLVFQQETGRIAVPS